MLTLALLAGFAWFGSAQEAMVWPVAVLLGLVWGAIGIWMVRRGGRSANAQRREGEADAAPRAGES